MTEKNWWQRYRIIIIVFAVIAIAIIYLLMSDIFGLKNFAKAYSEMPLYEKALAQVKDNEEVQDNLGEIQPIDKMAIAEGNVAYIGDSISTTVTVKGAKGKAKMDISAVKENGLWNYKLIKIRIKESRKEILVLNN